MNAAPAIRTATVSAQGKAPDNASSTPPRERG